MITTTTVFILIVAICAIVFLVAVYKILGKGKKGSKKEKKAKAPKKAKQSSEVKTEDLKPIAPKINKEKLKKIESESAKIEPAFSKEELDRELAEKLEKEAEKSKAAAQQTFTYPNFNAGAFKFQPNPTQPTFQPQQKPKNPFATTIIKTEEPNPVVAPVEAKKEDKDFVQLLKERKIIKKEQSFGESLMVKEAIDTPVSKNEMKKKRQKWI